MSSPEPSAVPVIPNCSRVRGRLVQIRSEPGGDGSEWEILVQEAGDIENLPNFVKAHVGERIRVYVHQQLKHNFTEKELLEARVAFRGDERGGRFVLIGDDARRV